MRVPIQFAALLVQDLTPKFTVGSKRHALIPVLAISIPLLCYFAWLYYREWKIKREFRRYWEGKRRDAAD